MGRLWRSLEQKRVLRIREADTAHVPVSQKNPGFTLSFFAKEHRDALNFCGSHSGRDVDKVQKTGLTPAFTENGSVYFSEARMVLECAKLYSQNLDPAAFLDPKIEKNYPQKDYHRLYIGEIIQCMAK